MKRFLILALAAAISTSCSTDSKPDFTPDAPTAIDELYVSFDEEDTRIQLGENGRPVWNENDLVSVFKFSNSNDKYQFQGATGDTEGTIKVVETGEGTKTTAKIIAVYPYDSNYWLDWNTHKVEAYLPAIQAYLTDSYGIGSSIMVSSSDNDKLSFKNVCGWLKLQFTGSKAISLITLRGNSDEQIAGKIYINTADASCVLASKLGNTSEGGDSSTTTDCDGVQVVPGNWDQDNSNGIPLIDEAILTEVTLNCGSGVALNAKTPTAFYIALPPMTFEKGFTVTLVHSNKTEQEFTTTKSITIKRSHIVPMASANTETSHFDDNHLGYDDGGNMW